jgi:hypothetical protein
MKDEKSRGGENVEFDEKANEDRYFALLEHERINEMKAEFQTAESIKRQRQMATCPKCAGNLAQYTVESFHVERCENCEGIWLNKGELGAILKQQARGRIGAFLNRCFSKIEPGKM